MITATEIFMNEKILKERLKLSDRDIDLLAEVIDGGSNKEIANELCITESGVKNALRMMYRKIGVAGCRQGKKIKLMSELAKVKNSSLWVGE